MQMSEQWRDIPGYAGRYQINERGQVRSFYQGQYLRPKPKLLKPHPGKCGSWIVNLYDAHKRPRSITILRLMAIAWLDMPDTRAYVAYAKNGMKTDWAVENIGYGRRKDLDLTDIVRKPVRKVQWDTGEIVEVYPSVIAAADANYMSRASMIARLKKQHKKLQEEYIYEYDDNDRLGRNGGHYSE